MPSARLLLVEDEPAVAESLFQSLEEVFDVCWAETAADACCLVDSGEMDLVLLDCTLRSGSAADVLSRARRFGLPVVAMSGDADRGEPCRELGLPFLEKPFGLDVLIGTLGTALARNREKRQRETGSGGFAEPCLPVLPKVFEASVLAHRLARASMSLRENQMSLRENHWFVELRARRLKIKAHRDRCRLLPPLNKGDAERLVAEFIERRNGVTKCPVAYLVPLSGS